MASGESVGVAHGIEGTQGTLNQRISEEKAKDNEERVKKELDNLKDTDFFVAPNGKIISAKYKDWIGVNQRENLLKRATNSKLKNAINQLYRKNSVIGDGGTADIIRFEKATGKGLGHLGNTHIQKGREMVKYLENKVLKQNLSVSDRKLANELLRELKKAIRR